MKLAELLTRKRIRIPLLAGSLGEGVEVLLAGMGGAYEPDGRDAFARLKAEGGTEIHRPSPRTLVLLSHGDETASAGLGVSPEPLGDEHDQAVRVLLILRVGPRPRVTSEALEGLLEVLADPEMEASLLTASSVEEATLLPRLLDVPLAGEMKVSDYLTPLSYRIYPDTPIGEVADLMARKSLAAVPVVGEGLEVLGIITSAEALRHALRGRGRGGAPMKEVRAKDVMSRAVLCVTENQKLVDAATMMESRDLAQLPVVREGEIVGFLTREAVLRALLSNEW